MAVKWTKEQQKVIDYRNRNILVSAAAGSGKTAVLVERIIHRILEDDNPVDIDKLLVVTFTKAAAAEMRERISKAIENKRQLANENGKSDENLERQASLIHNAQITTIDAFCLFIVRNHFEEINLEPDFRIADSGEITLLENEVIAELFEVNYGRDDNTAFLNLIDSYSSGRNDTAVRELVTKIYHEAESASWPLKWISSLSENYHIKDAAEFLPFGDNGKALAAQLFIAIGQVLTAFLISLSVKKDNSINISEHFSLKNVSIKKPLRQLSREFI